MCAIKLFFAVFFARTSFFGEPSVYHMFSAVDNAGTCSIFLCVEANVKKKETKNGQVLLVGRRDRSRKGEMGGGLTNILTNNLNKKNNTLFFGFLDAIHLNRILTGHLDDFIERTHLELSDFNSNTQGHS